MTHKIFFSVCIIVSFCSSGQVDTTNSVITKSQQFDYTISVARDSLFLLSATNQLTDILLSKDSTKFHSESSHNIVNSIYVQLFPNHIPNNLLEYHFLNISRDSQNVYIDIVIRQILSSYGDEYKDMLYILSIYNSKMVFIDNKWVLDCTLRTNDWYCKQVGTITYYSDKKNVVTKSDKKEIKSFIKKITSVFRIDKKQLGDLSYFIGNRKNAFKILGFDYSLDITGMFMRSANVLINVTETPVDKHELTHYLLRQYELKSKFINEGVAVYYGGSNGYPTSKFVETQKQEFNLLDKQIQEDIITSFLKGEILPEYVMQFYALSSVIISLLVERYGENKLYELVRDYPSITPQKFIEIYKILPLVSIDKELMSFYAK